LAARTVIEARDLLDEINPVARRLIRWLVARPCSVAALADATRDTPGTRLTGPALHEFMWFRAT
jgi:hypothetical protein